MNANVSIYQDSVKDSSGILTSESNEMGLSTIFNYNGNNVAFIKTSYGILINATDMARPYNKRPVDYLRQIYVNELVSTIVSQTRISEDQLVIKMRGSSEISTIPPIWCIPFLQNLTPVVSKSKNSNLLMSIYFVF